MARFHIRDADARMISFNRNDRRNLEAAQQIAQGMISRSIPIIYEDETRGKELANILEIPFRYYPAADKKILPGDAKLLLVEGVFAGWIAQPALEPSNVQTALDTILGIYDAGRIKPR